MSSSKLDCAQKFLNVAEQRYQEACDAKEIGDAKAVRRKIKEALSILSNLDKDIDKPEDWQALFAIADEISARKTNHQDRYNDKYEQ